MNKEERDYRKKKEVELFFKYVIILGALLFLFLKLSSIMSFAEGYSFDENLGEFVIDITTSDGGDESLQQPAPNIIYAGSASSGSDISVSDVPDNVNNGSSGTDSGPAIIYGEGISKDDRQAEITTSIGEIEDNKVYVPDSNDDCPVSSAVPLAVEVQEYIWKKCKEATGDYKNYYAFILGAIQHESDFKRTAIHYNSNGTVDRGLMQINSCRISPSKRAGLITCTDDLWDIYKNIDCGFLEMNEYLKLHGVSESTYFGYNTGRSKGGSNKNSRIVMKYMSAWNAILFGEK